MRLDQRGQFVIEFILLICLSVAVLFALTNKLREAKVIPGLVTGPWAKIAGMTETGTWNAADDATRKKHPNTYGRFFTPKEN